MVIFNEKEHSYRSVLPGMESVRFYSVSGFVQHFCNPFDTASIALRVSKKASSKWYGMDPKDIAQVWADEADRSVRVGNIVHAIQEKKVLAKKQVALFGQNLDVFPCLYNDQGEKISFNQKIYDGVHPEMLIYRQLSDKIGLAGQSDFPVFVNKEIHIGDYKTVKELAMENRFKTMLYPFNIWPDTNYYHYTLQLNMYAHIIRLNNPDWSIGKLSISHVEFNVKSYNQYGYPNVDMVQGVPSIKKISKVPVEVVDPGMLDEAINIWSSAVS